jgi:divalent metal cation (Fe/Co/Zn/Cd) transporter
MTFSHCVLVIYSAVGGYMLHRASLILKTAVIDLMDESLPEKFRNDITKAIMSVAGVNEKNIEKQISRHEQIC